MASQYRRCGRFDSYTVTAPFNRGHRLYRLASAKRGLPAATARLQSLGQNFLADATAHRMRCVHAFAQSRTDCYKTLIHVLFNASVSKLRKNADVLL